MAIFRAETKHITRSKKHNAVAAAAYRAGEKLIDTNKLNPDAKVHDYSKKQGVIATGIILPSDFNEQGFSIDRETLWSSVEEHETTTRSVKGSRLKQQARLAREWLLSLPHELSDDENEQLTQEFTEILVNDLGVIADYAIHKPTKDSYKPKPVFIDWYDPDTNTSELVQVDVIEPSQPDSRNAHAHIMFTTRKAELTADGSLKYGEKADSERSEKWRKEQKMCNGGDYIKEVRQLWSDLINKRLEKKNFLPVTAKSYKDLGLDIVPQAKRGKSAQAISIYGLEKNARIKDINDDFTERNRAFIKSTADSYTTTSSKRIDESKQRLSNNKRQLEDSEQRIVEQVRRIKLSNTVYDRASQFNPRTIRTVSKTAERTREREQLATQRLNREQFYKRTTAQAFSCYESNLRVIANRLAWRKKDSQKYDDRQMKELDTFYKTLDIQDFDLKSNASGDKYIAPQQWTNFVLEHLTVDHILDYPNIARIVVDPVSERFNSSRSLKSDSQVPSSSEIVQTPINDAKTSENVDTTSLQPRNIFMP